MDVPPTGQAASGPQRDPCVAAVIDGVPLADGVTAGLPNRPNDVQIVEEKKLRTRPEKIIEAAANVRTMLTLADSVDHQIASAVAGRVFYRSRARDTVRLSRLAVAAASCFYGQRSGPEATAEAVGRLTGYVSAGGRDLAYALGVVAGAPLTAQQVRLLVP